MFDPIEPVIGCTQFYGQPQHQIQNGIPVYPAEIVVHFDENDVVGTTGACLPDVASPAAPIVSSQTAVSLALLHVGAGSQQVGNPLLRMIVPHSVGLDGNNSRLAWQVAVHGPARNADTFVDAYGDEIVLEEPRERDAFDLDLWTGNNMGPAGSGIPCWGAIPGETLWYTEAGQIGEVTPYTDRQTAFDAIRAVYDCLARS